MSWSLFNIFGKKDEKPKWDVPIHPEIEPTKLVITELEKIISVYKEKIQQHQGRVNLLKARDERGLNNFQRLTQNMRREKFELYALNEKIATAKKTIAILVTPKLTRYEYTKKTESDSFEEPKEAPQSKIDDYLKIPADLIPNHPIERGKKHPYYTGKIQKNQEELQELHLKKPNQAKKTQQATEKFASAKAKRKENKVKIKDLTSKINNIKETCLDKIRFFYYMTKYHLLMLEEKMPEYQINDQVNEMSAAGFVQKNESLTNYPPHEMFSLVCQLQQNPAQLKQYMKNQNINKDSHIIEKLIFDKKFNKIELPTTLDIAKSKIDPIVYGIQKDIDNNEEVELEDIATILRTFFNLCFIYGVQDQDDNDFIKIGNVLIDKDDDFEEEEEEEEEKEISQAWFNQGFIEFTFKVLIDNLKKLELNTPMLREKLLDQMRPKQFDDDMRLMKAKEYCPFNQYMYKILQDFYTREWSINRWLLFASKEILNIADIFKNNQMLLIKLRTGIDRSLYNQTPIEKYSRGKVDTLQHCCVQQDNSRIDEQVYVPSPGLYIPLKQKLRTLMYDLTLKAKDIDIERMIQSTYSQFVTNLTEVNESELLITEEQLTTNLNIYLQFLNWTPFFHKGSYYNKATENTNEPLFMQFADEFSELYQNAKKEIFKTMPLIMTDQNESAITNAITKDDYKELEKVIINHYFAKTSNEEEEEEVEGEGEGEKKTFTLAAEEEQHEMHSMEDIAELIKKSEALPQLYNDYQTIIQLHERATQLQNYGPKVLIKKKIKEKVNILFELIAEYNGRVSLDSSDAFTYYEKDSSSKGKPKEIDLQKAIGMNAWMSMLYREFKIEQKETTTDGYDSDGVNLTGLGGSGDEETKILSETEDEGL